MLNYCQEYDKNLDLGLTIETTFQLSPLQLTEEYRN